MKRFLMAAFIAVFSLLALPTLQGCGTLVSQVAGERATVGKVIASVTTVRDMVTAGLNADKIKAADAENVRTQLNAIRQGADVADGLVKQGDVTGADAKIKALQAAVDALRAYLITQGVKPS
jgi:uncharacterized protein YceK